MHRIIKADVPQPLWDEFRGIMVLPAVLTDAEADAAVVELVRERSGDATADARADGRSPAPVDVES